MFSSRNQYTWNRFSLNPNFIFLLVSPVFFFLFILPDRLFFFSFLRKSFASLGFPGFLILLDINLSSCSFCEFINTKKSFFFLPPRSNRYFTLRINKRKWMPMVSGKNKFPNALFLFHRFFPDFFLQLKGKRANGICLLFFLRRKNIKQGKYEEEGKGDEGKS